MTDEFDWIHTNAFTDGPELETTRQLDQPKLHYRRNAKREFRTALAKEALTRIVPELPDTNTVLYCLSNGAGSETRHGHSDAFSFGDFIPHVVRLLGDKDCRAYIATWTCARSHTLSMLQMLEDERLQSLVFFCDPYFKRREAAICAEFILKLEKFGERGRLLAFKTHAKLIAISNPAGRTCVIASSANLSSQPRVEQFSIDTHPGVYEWLVRDYFEEMLNSKEDQFGFVV